MFLCAECKQPVAVVEDRPEKGEEGSFVFSCPMCGHRWTALDKPDEDELIEWFVTLYLPVTTPIAAEDLANRAAKAAEAFGYNRGWKPGEIKEFMKRVQNRLMWRVGLSSNERNDLRGGNHSVATVARKLVTH